MPRPRKTKIRLALLAAVPAAVVLAALLQGKKKTAQPENGNAVPAARPESDRREE
jgi:hypothetical protein